MAFSLINYKIRIDPISFIINYLFTLNIIINNYYHRITNTQLTIIISYIITYIINSRHRVM